VIITTVAEVLDPGSLIRCKKRALTRFLPAVSPGFFTRRALTRERKLWALLDNDGGQIESRLVRLGTVR